MDTDSPNAFGGLLAADEPLPWTRLNQTPRYPALLVCDHASARIPARLRTLGLPASVMTEHVALDLGAADLCSGLSQALSLPAIQTSYSRLVVDCNRRLDDPSAFPVQSDGCAVPGNLNLTSENRQLRAESIYWPYHHRIRDELTGLESMAPAPALVSVHSFTPVFDGRSRPWHAGVLWDQDPRIAVPLLRGLRAETGLCVGDNQPYSGKHPADFTVDHHAEGEGLPNVSIEVRQDLIATPAGIREWTERLAKILQPLLSDSNLYVHWSGTARCG